MPNTNLENLKPELEAIDLADIVAPDIPMAMALQESNDLATLVSTGDVKAKLESVGCDPSTLASLANVVDAARAAQSAWVVVRDRSKSDAQRAKEQEATQHRGEILEACRWNLRDDRLGLATVAAIAEGEGIEDLIQDLRDLAILLDSRQGAFANDKTFDVQSAISRAKTLANDTAAGLSAERLTSEQQQAKNLRDRAFTYLADQVSTLRAAGRYAYRGDPATRTKFASAYLRRKRRRTKQSAATPASPATPTPGQPTNA